MTAAQPIRRLVVVLGDQLDAHSAVFDEFDPARDRVWMAEAVNESQHVWSHKARIVLFLSAMRHFRDQLQADGVRVAYLELADNARATLGESLARFLAANRPAEVMVTEPGDYRLGEELRQAVAAAGLTLQITGDRHFICSRKAFDRWAGSRTQLRLEHFYRHMRRQTGILMDGEAPQGSRWNFDADNRKAFGNAGPGELPPWPAFSPDATTRAVIRLVEERFPGHPGSLADFDWPVTRADALLALEDFVTHRLPAFGPFQDAMWSDEPFLYHSGLAAAMNLKLLAPAEVIQAALDAGREQRLPLASVEGFVRQVLGWREFVRGFYWKFMPGLADSNALDARQPLPDFYWSGDTPMACLRQTIGQIRDYGYAHHIQRLMVTGLFALLLGVRPQQVHAWYLAMFVDAVEWVELPNTLCMSQYADDGGLASKPYVASGRYIQRMSNYCAGCRFDPASATGADACPFTTLYWDFLQRHRQRFATHPRTALQWRNLARIDAKTLRSIQRQADRLRDKLDEEHRRA